MSIETRPGTGERQLLYYLPSTKVAITGKSTTRFLFSEGREVSSAEGQFSLALGADSARYFYFQDVDSLVADKELTLDYFPNGTLKSTDAVFTGKLGTIVQNLFSAASSFLPLILKAVTPALASMAVRPQTIEEEYAKAYPKSAALRASLRSAVQATLAAIAAKSLQLAETVKPYEVADLNKFIAQLHAQLEALQKQAAQIEAHFLAWKADREKAVERDYSFLLEISDLPKAENILTLKSATAEEVRAAAGAAAPVFDALGLILARDDKAPSPNAVNPATGSAAEGVFIRMVRPVVFSLFRMDEKGGAYSARFLEAGRHNVLDTQSPLCYMPIKKGFWSKKSLTVSFGEDGSVAKVDAGSSSELAALSEALGKLPPELLKGLQNANSVVDERQKLALQGIEQRISVLEKKKKVVEQEQLLNESLALGNQTLAIKELEKEIALLEKQKQLAALGGAQTSQIDALGLQHKLLEAETRLERAEVERLKVQAELEKLRKGSE